MNILIGFLMMLLLSLAVLVFFSPIWIAIRYTKPGKYRFLRQIGIAFLCYMVLIGDEIIGGLQFNYICKTSPKLEVLVDNLEGRKVIFNPESKLRKSTDVKFTLVKIKKNENIYDDIETNEPVFKSIIYVAYNGSWFIRLIGSLFGAHGDGPYFFNDTCSDNYKERRELIKKYNMTHINRY